MQIKTFTFEIHHAFSDRCVAISQLFELVHLRVPKSTTLGTKHQQYSDFL